MVPKVRNQPAGAGHPGWRTIRHYAYVDRPYDACWTKLAEAPHAVLGAPNAAAQGTAAAALTAKRGGVEVSRTVTIRFGGIVCEEEMARMALRWQDSRHATWFPVFEGVLSLAPIEAGRHHVTQVGIVGRYRPPLGAAGAAADRLAGGEVAEEVIAGFVEAVAHRLEALIDEAATEPGEGGAGELDPTSGLSRILVTIDGLADRQGGAVAVSRQLAGTPGVSRAEVDPLAGVATIEYDPDACSLTRILSELDLAPPG